MPDFPRSSGKPGLVSGQWVLGGEKSELCPCQKGPPSSLGWGRGGEVKLFTCIFSAVPSLPGGF